MPGAQPPHRVFDLAAREPDIPKHVVVHLVQFGNRLTYRQFRFDCAPQARNQFGSRYEEERNCRSSQMPRRSRAIRFARGLKERPKTEI